MSRSGSLKQLFAHASGERYRKNKKKKRARKQYNYIKTSSLFDLSFEKNASKISDRIKSASNRIMKSLRKKFQKTTLDPSKLVMTPANKLFEIYSKAISKGDVASQKIKKFIDSNKKLKAMVTKAKKTATNAVNSDAVYNTVTKPTYKLMDTVNAG